METGKFRDSSVAINSLEMLFGCTNSGQSRFRQCYACFLLAASSAQCFQEARSARAVPGDGLFAGLGALCTCGSHVSRLA